MAEHNDFGKEAEIRAVKYLKEKGYKILETNWRYLKAEIDIIAQQNDELIIVEVKARNSDIIAPEDAVTLSKKKLLLMATDHYIIVNDIDTEVRFDIISIFKNGNKWEITHIEEAFNALL